MHEVRFRVRGLTARDYRRWKKFKRFSSPTFAIFSVPAVVIGSFYLIKLIVESALLGLVQSPVASVWMSGAFPVTFTSTAGIFRLSVSPLDQDGKLASAGLDVNNFAFESITVSDPDKPGEIIGTARAYPTEVKIIAGQDPQAALSLLMLFDSSSSMDKNDPGRLRIAAGKDFVSGLDPGAKAAVMDFTGLRQGFTTEIARLNQAIEAVDARDNTPLFRTIIEAIDRLRMRSTPNRVLLIFTDGIASDRSLGLLTLVVKARVSKVRILSIGLGSNIDFSDLEKLAEQTGGSFAHVVNVRDVRALFKALAVAVSHGRILVTGQGRLFPPLPEYRSFVVSGTLVTAIGGMSMPTQFRFTTRIEQ